MPTSKTANQRQTVTISCRVTKRFFDIVVRYCNMGSHLNPGDLLRDSLREKIERDCPRLFSEMFDEGKDAPIRNVCDSERADEGELQ